MSSGRPGRYRIQPLDDHHRRPGFSCGVEALDRYFYHQASQDRRRGLAMPYILVDTVAEAVAGYYTLSSFAIVPTSLPHDVLRRLPRYELVPALLIGRLAVDHRYRGQGLGGALLVDALRRSLDTSRQIGVMAVVVEAKDDAARNFYERHHFRRFEDHAHRLYLPIAEISRL